MLDFCLKADRPTGFQNSKVCISLTENYV